MNSITGCSLPKHLKAFCGFNLGETCWGCSLEAPEAFQPKADQLFLLEILPGFEGAVGSQVVRAGANGR